MKKKKTKNDREISFKTCGKEITMENNYRPVFGRGFVPQEQLNGACERLKKREFRKLYRKKREKKPTKIKITKAYIEVAHKLGIIVDFDISVI